MEQMNLSFSATQAGEGQEHIAIRLGSACRGEATVRYDDHTAHLEAHIDVQPLGLAPGALSDFHHEFARELVAYVLNRGAAAQEPEGVVTYNVGGRAMAFELPPNPDLGLGYPNSW